MNTEKFISDLLLLIEEYNNEQNAVVTSIDLRFTKVTNQLGEIIVNYDPKIEIERDIKYENQ